MKTGKAITFSVSISGLSNVTQLHGSMQIFVKISTGKMIPLAVSISRLSNNASSWWHANLVKTSLENPASGHLHIEDVKRCSSSRRHANFLKDLNWKNHPSSHFYIQVVKWCSSVDWCLSLWWHAKFRQDFPGKTIPLAVLISRLSNGTRF